MLKPFVTANVPGQPVPVEPKPFTGWNDFRARGGRNPQPDDKVVVIYTNYRGETAQRTIRPERLWFGTTDWHPTPGWLLKAWDFDKRAYRDFAMSGFEQWSV